MVQLKNIQKYFSSNGIKALDGADFELRKGEIHALLGENGAGKSTLMHVMAGFMKPGGKGLHGNPGVIIVEGRERRFSSPAQALSMGIGMVRQHPRQIPGFSVWENCAVGSGKCPPLWLFRRSCRKQIAALDERLGFRLPLDSPVEMLSVSQGQKAAILALLARNVKYLIFDEPATVLSPVETENLFKILSALRNEGRGIVLISHNLEETLKIADRVTVLRQGRSWICGRAKALSKETLYKTIFGEEATSDFEMRGLPSAPAKFIVSSVMEKTPVLSLRNFKVKVPGHPLIRGINLELKQGKIIGIAGVQESGLETLELAVTGFLPFSGIMRINGTELSGGRRKTAKRVRAFRDAGGTYLGMRNEGTQLPIKDLLLIHAHRHFQNRGILERTRIDAWVKAVMEAARVPHRERAASNAFSGGQLQRLLLTREMAEHGSLLVLSNPGRSLDGHSRKKLAFLLRERVDERTAVLIFSTDLEELIELSDSVIVLRNGAFSGILELTNREGFRHNQIHKAKLKIQEAMVGQA